MKRYGYFYHGLHVSSELELAEWSRFSEDPRERPDVDVSLHLSDPADSACAEAGEHRFIAERAGKFVIRDGRHIVVSPSPDASPQSLQTFVMGSAWATILYQRQRVVMHGSAVQTATGAALFCARTGSGKSTTAALLSNAGFPLISDDMCCLDVPGGGPVCVHPSTPYLRLCEDTAHQLGLGPEPAVRGEKLHVQPEHLVNGAVPVSKIYVLRWGKPRIQPLRGFSALTALVENATWRGKMLKKAGDPDQFLLQCCEITSRVEIFDYIRNRNSELAASLQVLIDHIRGR